MSSITSHLQNVPLYAVNLNTILECSFYSALHWNVENSYKFVKTIKSTAIKYIHEIQVFFNAVNVAALMFCTRKLVDEVQKKYSILPTKMPFKENIAALAIAGTVLTIAHLAIMLYQKLVASPKKANNVKEELSLKQKIAERLHTTQFVVNTALAFVTQNYLFVALNLIGVTYNYFKNKQIKWLSFSKSKPVLNTHELSIDMKILSLASKLNAKDGCGICLDENSDPAMTFCLNHHVFHKQCVAGLTNNKDWNVNVGGTIDIYRKNGNLSIPQKNLPVCPTCRAAPCHVDFEATVDNYFNVQLNLTGQPPQTSIFDDKQALFKKMYAVYNIAQAGLAYIQRNPELAATIFKIQKWLLITDILSLCATYYFVYENLIEKFKLSDRSIAIVTISMIAFTALSVVGLIWMNSYLKPAIILKDIANTLPSASKGITFAWSAPLMHYFIQWVSLQRIFSNAILSSTSSFSIVSWTGVAAQVYSLFQISCLPWIQATQVLLEPLKNLDCTYSMYLNKSTVKSMTAHSYFLVPSTDTENLKGSISYIGDCVNKMFAKSYWDRFWLVTRQNGFEVSRQLKYDIKLNGFAPSVYPLPHLEAIEAFVIDVNYGFASANIY